MKCSAVQWSEASLSSFPVRTPPSYCAPVVFCLLIFASPEPGYCTRHMISTYYLLNESMIKSFDPAYYSLSGNSLLLPFKRLSCFSQLAILLTSLLSQSLHWPFPPPSIYVLPTVFQRDLIHPNSFSYHSYIDDSPVHTSCPNPLLKQVSPHQLPKYTSCPNPLLNQVSPHQLPKYIFTLITHNYVKLNFSQVRFTVLFLDAHLLVLCVLTAVSIGCPNWNFETMPSILHWLCKPFETGEKGKTGKEGLRVLCSNWSHHCPLSFTCTAGVQNVSQTPAEMCWKICTFLSLSFSKSSK